ncbi:MAG: UDP binding domain-containing protein, partial [Acidiferrobacterales bacterium]|nr:UDP binding domain-containing protein [Acidiferrobacterales bacterium]
ESDDRAGAALTELYQTFCENTPPIRRMNLVNAELSKISVNTFVTTKISYANMLAQVCERLPGADVDVVTGAIGLDSRIGTKYLKGAVSYGGPCFPRDNRAFARLAENFGVSASIALSTDEINDRHIDLIKSRVLQLSSDSLPVCVLGLSYKPGTYVVDESPGLKLAMSLLDAGKQVVVHDPMAMDATRAILTDKVAYAQHPQAAVADCSVVAIMTAWPEFKSLLPVHFRPEAVIIDCWKVLKEADFQSSQTVLHVGVGPQQDKDALEKSNVKRVGCG